MKSAAEKYIKLLKKAEACTSRSKAQKILRKALAIEGLRNSK